MRLSDQRSLAGLETNKRLDRCRIPLVLPNTTVHFVERRVDARFVTCHYGIWDYRFREVANLFYFSRVSFREHAFADLIPFYARKCHQLFPEIFNRRCQTTVRHNILKIIKKQFRYRSYSSKFTMRYDSLDKLRGLPICIRYHTSMLN